MPEIVVVETGIGLFRINVFGEPVPRNDGISSMVQFAWLSSRKHLPCVWITDSDRMTKLRVFISRILAWN
jgi:hypothetical protein